MAAAISFFLSPLHSWSSSSYNVSAAVLCFVQCDGDQEANAMLGDASAERQTAAASQMQAMMLPLVQRHTASHNLEVVSFGRRQAKGIGADSNRRNLDV